jgi:hypothetical protein
MAWCSVKKSTGTTSPLPFMDMYLNLENMGQTWDKGKERITKAAKIIDLKFLEASAGTDRRTKHRYTWFITTLHEVQFEHYKFVTKCLS